MEAALNDPDRGQTNTKDPSSQTWFVLSLYRSYLTTAPFDASNPPVHAALSASTLDHFTDTMRLCTPRKIQQH
jgi:hypothetical protein